MRKMYIICLLLVFSVSCFVLYGQDDSRNRLGSANILDGNIYILSVFVSDHYYGTWTKNEKDNILIKEIEALNWLRQQGAQRNIDINFSRHCFGYDSDILLDYIRRGDGTRNEDIDIVRTVLSTIGYQSPLSFYNWVLNNTSCTNVLVIIYIKENGRSYHITYNDPRINRELYFIEGIAIYENYENGVPTVSASIAHEILHNFGAWDLNQYWGQTNDIHEQVSRLFPNSIMHRVDFDIWTLNIDPITEWLIGWNNNPELWYDVFRPPHLR